jgi:hypothetical protein
LDTGEAPVGEAGEQAALKRQGRRVHLESFIAGLLLTLPFVFLL